MPLASGVASNYVPIKELLPALHPSCGAQYLLVIHFYIDCSGTAKDVVRVAAGYLGTGAQWETFEDEWRLALRAAKVKTFHATDLYSHRGEFKSWDKKREIKFAKRFTAIAEKQTELGVAMGMEVAPFNDLLADLLKGLRSTPHRRVTSLMFCTVALLNRVAKEHAPPNEQIAVVFEGERGIGEVIEFYNMAKRKDEPWTRVYASVTSGGKELLPLQAADLVAHESWRRVKEFLYPEGRGRRKTLNRLLQSGMLEIRVITEADIRKELPNFRRYLTASDEFSRPLGKL